MAKNTDIQSSEIVVIVIRVVKHLGSCPSHCHYKTKPLVPVKARNWHCTCPDMASVQTDSLMIDEYYFWTYHGLFDRAASKLHISKRQQASHSAELHRPQTSEATVLNEKTHKHGLVRCCRPLAQMQASKGRKLEAMATASPDKKLTNGHKQQSRHTILQDTTITEQMANTRKQWVW